VTPPTLSPQAANFWLGDGKAGTANLSPRPSLTPEQELSAYRLMLLIRRFEEKAGQLYGMGFIGGFCHLYIGQEAVVAGMQMAISDGDQVITAYRDHGHMLAAGMEPKRVMAELTGRRHGYAKGKGGSMHMFSVEKNFYGGHGIVGAPAPLGTGIAFANKYRGNDRVCLTYFGEGAANQGQVYESFNMASLWKLPVIYVIENNHYAMGTHVGRGSALAEELYHRGSVFGIPGEQVDGMDVAAVRKPATGPWRGRGAATGRRSSKCSPIAIAAIPCPTPPNTAPARRSRRCASIATRSTCCASASLMRARRARPT
jgi:pyruvate dehydrogenase E1 component alpha subunit